MQILYSKTAVKAINRMDAKLKTRIREAIEAIPAGDIKPMQGMENIYRLRVGQYRVLYTWQDDCMQILLVLDIGSRGDIYK